MVKAVSDMVNVYILKVRPDGPPGAVVSGLSITPPQPDLVLGMHRCRFTMYASGSLYVFRAYRRTIFPRKSTVSPRDCGFLIRFPLSAWRR